MNKRTALLLLIVFTSCRTKPVEQFKVSDFKSSAPFQYDISDDKISFWKDRIDEITHGPQVSMGPKKNLYGRGITSFDSWYPTPPIRQESKKPLTNYPYYVEFNYVDGLLVTVYGIQGNKRELAYRLWHNQQEAPILCVLYANGQEALYNLAFYNDSGLISEVVTLDQDYSPLWISIFEHIGLYETCMQTTYGRNKDYRIQNRGFSHGDGIWIETDDGKWRRANSGSMCFWLNSLEKFGIKPHYPIPEAQPSARADAASHGPPKQGTP